jgi:hypothetical protein
MQSYKLISVGEFSELKPEKLVRLYYELKGIARAVILDTKGKNELDKFYQYHIDFFLQERNELIPAHLESSNAYCNFNKHLLLATSESNIEVTVRGYCEPFLNLPRLFIEELVVRGVRLQV